MELNNYELNKVLKDLAQIKLMVKKMPWLSEVENLLHEVKRAEEHLSVVDSILTKLDEACDTNEPGYDRAQELVGLIKHGMIHKGNLTADDDAEDGIRVIWIYFADPDMNTVATFRDWLDAADALNEASEILPFSSTKQDVMDFLCKHTLAVKE